MHLSREEILEISEFLADSRRVRVGAKRSHIPVASLPEPPSPFCEFKIATITPLYYSRMLLARVARDEATAGNAVDPDILSWRVSAVASPSASST